MKSTEEPEERVHPLILIDRTNMPPIDTLNNSYEAFCQYRTWNQNEIRRLDELSFELTQVDQLLHLEHYREKLIQELTDLTPTELQPRINWSFLSFHPNIFADNPLVDSPIEDEEEEEDPAEDEAEEEDNETQIMRDLIRSLRHLGVEYHSFEY